MILPPDHDTIAAGSKEGTATVLEQTLPWNLEEELVESNDFLREVHNAYPYCRDDLSYEGGDVRRLN